LFILEHYLDFACELGDNFTVKDRGAVKFTCAATSIPVKSAGQGRSEMSLASPARLV
jgi:hypothetical protein